MCICAEEEGCFIYNILDQNSLELRSVIKTGSDNVSAMKSNNSILYLGDESGGIQIVDFHYPFEPVHLTSLQLEGFIKNFYFEENYLYCASGSGGIYIYDVSNVYNPQLISQFNTNGHAYDLLKNEDNLFISDYHNGLLILDITDKGW